MSGRPKLKVYEYSHQGKYMGYYESISDVRKKYFSHIKGVASLFKKEELGHKYELLEDSILFQERVYRDDVKYIMAILNSPFCNLPKSKEGIVQVFNYKKVLLAEFQSLNIASKMLPHIPKATIVHQLNESKDIHRYEPANQLFFRYKKQ